MGAMNVYAGDEGKWVQYSEENLELVQADWDQFKRRLVMGGETWIHHYNPETKKQSRQCKHKISLQPKKFKVQPSVGKIMCTISHDADCVVLNDCILHKVTVTGAYCADLLQH